MLLIIFRVEISINNLEKLGLTKNPFMDEDLNVYISH